MVTTNFPSGVTSYGVPVVGSGQLPITSGNYWFVSSVSGSTGNPGNEADLPFATLAGAVSAAASGDVIVLLPNHAETISGAAGIALSKAGLTIVGQGEGSTRPTFTFGTSTAATMTISGAGVSISNIIGVCNIDQLVSAFVISAADVTFGLPGAPVEWHDGAANKEALRAVLTTAAADRLNINMNYFGFTAGTHGVNAIRLVGCDTGNITINYYGICTTAVVEFLTTACTNIEVYGYMYVFGITNFTRDVVDTQGSSTWFANFFDGAYGGLVSGGSGSALASAGSAGVAAVNNTAEKCVRTTAAVISNALVLFTVTGPVEVMAIGSICATANDTTASTLQYSSTGTLGSTTQTFSGASASLASATAGTTVLGLLTALTTAPSVNANAAGLISTGPSSIFVPLGSITAVVGVGSTTGTWSHFIRYRPLASGAAVTAAF